MKALRWRCEYYLGPLIEPFTDLMPPVTRRARQALWLGVLTLAMLAVLAVEAIAMPWDGWFTLGFLGGGFAALCFGSTLLYECQPQCRGAVYDIYGGPPERCAFHRYHRGPCRP